MEFLPFFSPHSSIHPIHSAVEIPQAIFHCIVPGVLSFGVYSCNTTGYDLFLLSNSVSTCPPLPIIPICILMSYFSFLPHKQSHPCTHLKTLSYPSVDSTPHLSFSGFFLTSLQLYISSSLHLPSSLPHPQLSCPFPCPSLYLLSSFIPALYFSHSRLTSIPLH